jgi:hypothetical protein
LIRTAITAGTSRVAHGPLCLHAVANTPAGLMEFVRSYHSTNFGLPSNRDGSAPALRFSRPAQRLLTLRPACSPGRLRDPLHQRLQQSRCLHCCSDCYRVERTSSRAGLPPLWTTAFHGAPGFGVNQLKAGSESRLFRLPVVQLAKSVPYLPLRTLSSLVIGAPPQALPRWNNPILSRRSDAPYRELYRFPLR